MCWIPTNWHIDWNTVILNTESPTLLFYSLLYNFPIIADQRILFNLVGLCVNCSEPDIWASRRAKLSASSTYSRTVGVSRAFIDFGVLLPLTTKGSMWIGFDEYLVVEQYLDRNTSEDRYRRVRNSLDSIVSGKVDGSKEARMPTESSMQKKGSPRSAFQWLSGAQTGPDHGEGIWTGQGIALPGEMIETTRRWLLNSDCRPRKRDWPVHSWSSHSRCFAKRSHVQNWPHPQRREFYTRV